MIIDEAQHIKNHDTAQAKAIKSIGADNFIAMSGTPVENRLSELWSIVMIHRFIAKNTFEERINEMIQSEQ